MRKRTRFQHDHDDEDRVAFDEFTNPVEVPVPSGSARKDESSPDRGGFSFGRSLFRSRRANAVNAPEVGPAASYDLNIYEPQVRSCSM